MQLKCKINNNIYEVNLVQGVPFSDEYTEVLDSSTIILDQIPEIKNIKPYDDVYIFEGEFDGFDDNGKVVGKCSFYKHFLVDQYQKEHLNFNDDTLYKYTIQLFSETKGLETIQLPNISITQPLNIDKKISIYKYLQQYIDMYSPKIKVAKNDKEWEYKNKYKLSSDVVDIMFETDTKMYDVFGKSYSPDFSLNNPNLKDVLSKLMLVKDRIPYVYNNVIYALDITKRREKPFDFSSGEFGFVTSSQTSQNYCDNLKRTYMNALGQPNTCKSIEYIGFRNSDTPLMKISDLRIETRFPIYKINKVYMCYYKIGSITNLSGAFTDEYRTFLCKQDITSLVKMNSERNLLSQDWDDFTNEKPNNIEELSKYKLATVGYDIGSNYITGWGTQYTYPRGWWDTTATYIENIFKFVDLATPYGIYDYDYVSNNITGKERLFYSENGSLNCVVSPYSNDSLKLKSFFFIVEYDGFYNGTVITTKDGAESDITINDNQSNSLALLEEDGLAQKEKINRFGNANFIITARYKNINDLQDLGTVYKDDIIIYHREYTIFANYILCTYYGMKDYVLKNYFTSVYAKHRPYNLMSYGESVYRSENKKVFLLLSKNAQYFENENISLNFKNFNDGHVNKIFSCFKENEHPTVIDNFIQNDNINSGYLIFYQKDGTEEKFSTDINTFVSGNSMCFNLKMYDNVSMGLYIKKSEPFESDDYEKRDEQNNVIDYLNWIIKPEETYSGSLQDWYMNVDDVETGFAKKIGFYVEHVDQSENILDEVISNTDKQELKKSIVNIYKDKIFKIPFLPSPKQKSNNIGNVYEINKDNKELIDMTFQLEPIVQDENIMFSPWFMKLSDLQGIYNKFSTTFEVKNSRYNSGVFQVAESTLENTGASVVSLATTLLINLIIDKKFQDEIKDDKKINTIFEFGGNKFPDDFEGYVASYKFKCKKIEKVEKNELGEIEKIEISGTQIITRKKGFWGPLVDYSKETIITFTNMKNDEVYGDRVPEDKIYLCNCYFKPFEAGGIISYDSYYNNEITYDNDIRDLSTDSVTNFKYFKSTLDTNFPLFNESNSNIKPFYIGTDLSLTKTYKKNMYIVISDEKLKKTLVYDELKENEINLTDKDIKDIFSIENNGDISYIKVNLENVDESKKSIQYWFFDEKSNSYKFVFGVNLKLNDFDKKEIKIYISQLSTMNKKVYNQNHQLIGEMKNSYTTEEFSSIRKSFYLQSLIEEENERIETWFGREILDCLKQYPYHTLREENGITCTFKIEETNGIKTYTNNYFFVLENDILYLVTDDENALIKKFVFTYVDDYDVIAYTDISNLLANSIYIKEMTWSQNEIYFSTHLIFGKQYYTKY